MTKESNRTDGHQMPVLELFLLRMREHDRIVEFTCVESGGQTHKDTWLFYSISALDSLCVHLCLCAQVGKCVCTCF